MMNRKVILMMVASIVFASYAFAVDPLVYDDFESYIVGGEGTFDGDLWLVWQEHGVGDAGNPSLRSYVDGTIKYAGNNSMRLEAPLMDYNSTTLTYFNSTTAGWGVQYRNDQDITTDVSQYNIMTVMVRRSNTSVLYDVDFVVRDVYGYSVGESGSISVPNDGNWHKIRVILNGEGEKTDVAYLLPFFDIEPNAPAGTGQLWVDNIQFEHTTAVDEILAVDVNGSLARAGETENYSFVMTGQPPADVNFTLYPPQTLDLGSGFGTPIHIIFTTSNWNVAQYKNIAIASAATGAQIVDVNAASTNADYNEALPGSFTVKMLGKYGAIYTISSSTPVWQDVPDESGIDLANGIVGEIWFDSADMFTDKDWVEWAPDQYSTPAYAEIVFDLGTVKSLNSVDIWHSAIDHYPPGLFELSYSTDGTTYTTPSTYEPYTLGMRRAKTRIDISPAVTTRYVKLKVDCVDNNPGNWFFLSEVEFNAPKPITYPVYTYDPNNTPSDPCTLCRDPYMSKLMNGAISFTASDANSFQYMGWVWFSNSTGVAYDNVVIFADYGKIKEFSNLSLNYATNMSSVPANKVWAPSEVKLSFSNDGVTYGTPVSLTGWYQGVTGVSKTTGRTDAKTFAPQSGRYVKIQIVRNTVNAQKMRLGEIILTNRPQMTYLLDTSTPVWGNSIDQPGDPAYGASPGPMRTLNFGDLADGHVPTDSSPYVDTSWVEWAPDAAGSSNPYGIVTFDLKSVQKVKNVQIAYNAAYAGKPAPGALEVAFSTDGTTYTTMTDVGAVFNNNNGDMNTPHIYNTIFALPKTDARYVKLKIHCRNDNLANWIYIGEVKFNVFTADLNDNGTVDYIDLKTMADQWLTSTGNPTADIAGYDGKVNFRDFAQFAFDWMEQ
jgi:hypothetical protein